MKQLFLAVSVLALLLVGCGSDDKGTDNGDPVLPSVTASTTATAPAMTSVNEATWAGVTETALKISASIVPPTASAKVSTLTDSIHVKAIKTGGRLYLRLQWSDDSLHMDRDVWQMVDPDNFNFTHLNVGESSYKEDQLYVLFEDQTNATWDTWNWRVLTTAQKSAAEDMSYDGSTLVEDQGSSPAAFENQPEGSRPSRVHVREHEFTGQVMSYDSTVSSSQALPGRLNWTVGQTVPGWFLASYELPREESRWDVDAIYEYDAAGDKYTVVLARDLAGQSDDLDMSQMARVKVKLAVLDNVKNLLSGSARRGLTEDFWLVLP
ncbi:MAG: hypothetical protein ABIE70_07740 [bacterium]